MLDVFRPSFVNKGDIQFIFPNTQIKLENPQHLEIHIILKMLKSSVCIG